MTRAQKLALIEAWAKASKLADSFDTPENKFPKGKQLTLKEHAVDLIILLDRAIHTDEGNEQ
jgi:predicted component of viral defense system (DUF524 family)